jgi:hypothetical protein
MAKQTINIGAAANDGTGDPIRTAFGKVNDNFTEIYTANTGVNTGDQNLAAYATTAAVAAGYQPLDSDLTAIAALTTTAYGRALLSTADAPTLRTAIGLGQTDAPTFLAQSLTGQSLTGTQATSLVDLAASWNTTGNPSLIYGRVVNTNSGGSSNLIDLGTFAGGSLFRVDKAGNFGSTLTTFCVGYGAFTQPGLGNFQFNSSNFISTSNLVVSNLYVGAADVALVKDAPGILAQRNVGSTQQFRLYNTTDAGNVNYERLELKLASGAFRIETARGGAGFRRSLILSVEGSPYFALSGSADASLAWWSIIASTGSLVCNLDNTYDIGASGANRPRNIYVGSNIVVGQSDGLTGKITIGIGIAGGLFFGNRGAIAGGADGVFIMTNSTLSDFSRIQLGGATDPFPAIARDGAGIKFTGAAAGSTSWIKVPAVTVANLPLASTAGVGARAFVNDALAPVFGSAVVGLGSVTVPVYSTGSAWNVG